MRISGDSDINIYHPESSIAVGHRRLAAWCAEKWNDSHNDSIIIDLVLSLSIHPISSDRQPFLNWLDRFHASFPSQHHNVTGARNFIFHTSKWKIKISVCQWYAGVLIAVCDRFSSFQLTDCPSIVPRYHSNNLVVFIKVDSKIRVSKQNELTGSVTQWVCVYSKYGTTMYLMRYHEHKCINKHIIISSIEHFWHIWNGIDTDSHTHRHRVHTHSRSIQSLCSFRWHVLLQPRRLAGHCFVQLSR